MLRAIILILAFTHSAMSWAAPWEVVSEPYARSFTVVSFDKDAYALSSYEREKLHALVNQIYGNKAAPVHECDIDAFNYEGFRGNESKYILLRQDLIFEQRVKYLKHLLAILGVPERKGLQFPPSQARPGPSAEIDEILIEVTQSVHMPNERYSLDHLECRWPLPAQ